MNEAYYPLEVRIDDGLIALGVADTVLITPT